MEQPHVIYKASGKNTFFEAIDATDIGKVSLVLTAYDPSKEEGNRLQGKVSYYLDPGKLKAIALAIAGGTIDEFLKVDNQFPASDFSNPKSGSKMRHWSMVRTERGLFQITVTEKSKAKTWDDKDAKILGKVSFFIRPFQFLSMISAIELYLNSNTVKKSVEEE